ncbi:hypothetical protein DEV91_14324 [Phyllobacterium brassicacearum]|nr:hypothetical protein DEV91_14324 [Phyllobacterium brassicacearum]
MQDRIASAGRRSAKPKHNIQAATDAQPKSLSIDINGRRMPSVTISPGGFESLAAVEVRPSDDAQPEIGGRDRHFSGILGQRGNCASRGRDR